MLGGAVSPTAVAGDTTQVSPAQGGGGGAGVSSPPPLESPPIVRSPEADVGRVASPMEVGMTVQEGEEQPGVLANLQIWLGLQEPKDLMIHEAARQRDLNLMKALIRQQPWMAAAPGAGFLTPLILSVRAGSLPAVKYLIDEAHVNASARDGQRRTALHHLGLGGLDSPLIVMHLMEMGRARVNPKDSYGRTPLHYACMQGLVNSARLLLQYKADPLVVDREGKGALEHCSKCKRPENAAEIRRVVLEAQAKRRAERAGLWSCSCLTDLCQDEEEDEVEEGPVPHQLVEVFQKAGVNDMVAINMYIENLRRFGYDNVLVLKTMNDKLLAKHIPDVIERRRVLKVLPDTYAPLPEPHLPIRPFLMRLLSCSEDLAHRYEESLRQGPGIVTGLQLLRSSYQLDLEPALHMAPPGHKKALRILLLSKDRAITEAA